MIMFYSNERTAGVSAEMSNELKNIMNLDKPSHYYYNKYLILFSLCFQIRDAAACWSWISVEVLFTIGVLLLRYNLVISNNGLMISGCWFGSADSELLMI